MRKEQRIQKIREGYCSVCVKQMAALGFMTCDGCRRKKRIGEAFRRLRLDSELDVTLLLEQEK